MRLGQSLTMHQPDSQYHSSLEERYRRSDGQFRRPEEPYRQPAEQYRQPEEQYRHIAEQYNQERSNGSSGQYVAHVSNPRLIQ